MGIIVIMGPMGSGKTTIGKELESKYFFRKLVTYTTRPKRDGEIHGVDYNFVTDRDFDLLFSHNFFAETQSYLTVDGVWRYGSSLKSYEKAVNSGAPFHYIILTPSSVEKLLACKYAPFFKFVQIDIDEDIRRERALKRGDDPKEVERRLDADRRDFDKSDDIRKLHPELQGRWLYIMADKETKPQMIADEIARFAFDIRQIQ